MHIRSRKKKITNFIKYDFYVALRSFDIIYGSMRIKYELNYFLAAALIRLRKLTNNRCNYVGRWNELK